MLATITRLVHDLGVTVVIAEHRLERVVQYADSIVHVPGDGTVEHGEPDRAARGTERRAADRRARSARGLGPAAALGARRPPPRRGRSPRELADVVAAARGAAADRRSGRARCAPAASSCGTDAVVAVRDVDLELRAGEIVALMGRNGAGKSSLLWALQGSGARDGGRVDVGGRDPADLAPGRGAPARSAWCRTRRRTCSTSTPSPKSSPGPTPSRPRAPGTRAPRSTASRPAIPDDTHPRDLSEGQRLALVLAVQLAAAPRVVLLDEPTRGLDYRAKRELGLILRELAADGHAVVVSTHDVEFVAATAHRVVVMAEGEIVADGADRVGDRRVARVRAAGREDPRAAAVAHRRAAPRRRRVRAPTRSPTLGDAP